MNRLLSILLLFSGVLFSSYSGAQANLEFQLFNSSDNNRSISPSAICGEGLVLPMVELGERSRITLRISNLGNETILFQDSPYLYPESTSISLIETNSLKSIQAGESGLIDLVITNNGGFNATRTELKLLLGGNTECTVILQALEKVENLEVTKVDRLEEGEEIYRGHKIPFEIKVKNIGDGDLNDLEVETPVGDYLSVDPGSIRTSPLAIDDEYMGMMGGLNIDAASGVKANDFDDDLPNTTIQEAGSALATQEGGSVTLQDDGSFIYTPPGSPPVSGMDMFIYTLIDGNPLPGVVDNNDAKVTILLNNAPTADNQMVMVLEDEMPDPMITLTGSDPDMDMLTFMVVDNPTKGMLSGTPPNLTYIPNADENGNDSFTFKVNDGIVDSPLATVSIVINPVNDAPSFTKGGDENVNEDAGAQTVSNWATAISKGPANESTQNLTFNITGNTNPSLFSSGPAVNATGNLTYTPEDDANGMATITLELMDNGGTANGASDTSAPQMFTITVNPVNDPPTITCGPNQVVLNSAGAQSVASWASGISVGPANESSQNPPNITVANDNNALFSVQPDVSNSGTLTYTPSSAGFGFANVTVTISDGVFSDDVSCSFTITVQAAPMAEKDDFMTKLDTDLTGNNLFSDNGDGVDDLGFPSATIASFGGGSLGGAVTDNAAGSSVALAGGTLQVNADGSFSLTGQPFIAGTYTFDYRLQNAAGSSDATVTLMIMPLDDPAVCNADTYNGTGNITVIVDAMNGVLSNDGGTNLVVEAVEGLGGNVGVATAATNGTVTCNSDGSFTFIPTAGATTGSFSYTVDNPLNIPQTCTATINYSNMVWFIDGAVASSGSGNQNTPFKTIADFNAINLNTSRPNALANDYIYLADGTYSETNGFSLFDNQKLIGQGVSLTTELSGIITPISAPLPVATSNPVINVSGVGGDGVLLAANNHLKGLTINNTPNGFGIEDKGMNIGTPVIASVSVNGTGGAMKIENGGNLGSAAFDQLNSSNAPAEALRFRNCNGNMSITNATTGIGNSVGIGVSIVGTGAENLSFTYPGNLFKNNPGTIIRLDNIGGAINFTQTITQSNAGAGGALGIICDNFNGTATFTGTTNLGSINPMTFPGLTISGNGSGTVNWSGSGKLNITTINSRAIEIVSATNMPICNISGGRVISTGTLTGSVIDINALGASTITLDEVNINVNGGGIDLTNNGGSTFNFTNSNIITSGGKGFNMVGGGTINVIGTGNSLSSTNATAIEMINSSIGVTGINFQSISSSGATNGIKLTNTGTGIINVTGDGAMGSGISANNGSGGSISSTGDGILLDNVDNPSFNYMNITNCGNNGIKGNNINGIVINRCKVTDNGNVNSEYNIFLSELIGSIQAGPNPTTISNNLVDRALEDNVVIQNSTGTLSRLMISDCTIGGNNFIGNRNADDGITLNSLASGMSNANMNMTVNNSTFIGNGGDHICALQNGNLGSMDIVITGNTMSGTSVNPMGVGGGITLASGGGSNVNTTLTYNIDNNDITGTVLRCIDLNLGISTSLSTMSGIVNNNRFGSAGAPGSGSTTGNIIRAVTNKEGDHTCSITNNTMRNWENGPGIQLILRDGNGGNGSLKATVTGNMQSEPGTFAYGLQLSPGVLGSDNGTFCADIGGLGALANTFVENSGSSFFGDVYVDQSGSVTFNLPGYTGAANNPGAHTDLRTYFMSRNNQTGSFALCADSTQGPYFCGNLTVGVSNPGSSCP